MDLVTEDQKHSDHFAVPESAIYEFARNRYGIAEADLMAGYRALRQDGGRVDLREYVLFQLFDHGRHSASDRKRFVSERLHWPVVSQCCDMSWFAATEDKFLTELILSAGGISTPAILAVADRTSRLYPGKIKIRNAKSFRDFLASQAGKPFFGKTIRSVSAKGAFLCDHFDGRFVHLRGRAPVRFDDFFDTHIANNQYVFQPVIRNHPFLAAFSENLCTIRMVVLAFDNQIHLAASVLKIPSGSNVVDSALRLGNYVCEVEGSAGGRIASVVSTGPLVADRWDVFPENGSEIIGKSVPFWQEAMTLAAKAVALFAPVRLQSVDVAITPTGPTIIEVNTGGSFNMIQRATGRGFLQPDVEHFLNVVGVRMDGLEQYLPTL